MKKFLLSSIIILSASCEKKDSSTKATNNVDAQNLKASVDHLKKAKIFSDSAIIVINNETSGVIKEEVSTIHINLLKKSLQEANKVDSSLLNKAIKGNGTVYFEKYVKGIEFQIKGAESGDAKMSLKGQMLYDEYVNYMEQKLYK